ncbi:MAG: SpaH/EbpB family LPXTG-anchored major pilin [Microbacterium sp.]|jgi:fimbrial isopeptide formation D2 family protein/LPXTG-motif cell wall-anchored protein|nr:SpaH/EbpB family LPXTG-anchored major pilin [Microbacterium sp.]
MKKPDFRRMAGLGAAALAILASVVVTAPANADTPGGNVPPGPYSLTITKLENPAAGGTPTSGVKQTLTGATPIDGVNFSIAPVQGVDLSTSAGWAKAADLKVNNSGQVVDGSGTVYTTGSATPLAPTGPGGVTTYSTSNANVYLVTETSAPSGVQIGAPFLVELPMPQSSTNGWLTDVFVYPKNTKLGAPVKTVDDSGAHAVGDTVNWTVTNTVPNQAAGNPLVKYTLSDELDTRLTAPDEAEVEVSLAGAGGGAITLLPGDYSVDVTGQVLTVDFSATGLAKLTANPSSVITVKFSTVVNSVGEDGTITNVATLTSQSKSQLDNGTPPTETPSNETETTFGDVTLRKTDPNGIVLKDAEFQVFTSLDDAKALTNPVSVDGVTTFKSDANGAVKISGLKAQENGQGASLTYYIVETQAPAGFGIAAAWSQAQGGTAVTVNPGDVSHNEIITVVDPQAPAISLPLTGSTGTAIVLGGGLALAAIAAVGGTLIVRRRREAATQAV